MHELSVTESVLEISLRHANQRHAQNITAIHLVIGELASIVDDSVCFYWEIISKGTIAEGATLNFERRPARAMCHECEQEFPPEWDTMACPKCGSHDFKIVSGNEFYVAAIDIET